MANVVLTTVNKMGQECRMVVDEAASIIGECKRLVSMDEMESVKVDADKPAAKSSEK